MTFLVFIGYVLLIVLGIYGIMLLMKVTAAMREGREDKMAYNEARANRNFERSMSILGAQINNSSNQNTPSNRTYILNGKIINCSTFQNVTNCN